MNFNEMSSDTNRTSDERQAAAMLYDGYCFAFIVEKIGAHIAPAVSAMIMEVTRPAFTH